MDVMIGLGVFNGVESGYADRFVGDTRAELLNLFSNIQ